MQALGVIYTGEQQEVSLYARLMCFGGFVSSTGGLIVSQSLRSTGIYVDFWVFDVTYTYVVVSYEYMYMI